MSLRPSIKRKIVRLIYTWLKMTGGSDAYLLQEAKLKTDEIIKHGRSYRADKSS